MSIQAFLGDIGLNVCAYWWDSPVEVAQMGQASSGSGWDCSDIRAKFLLCISQLWKLGS